MNLDNSNRQAHRIMGLVLLLPFLAWSATGMFFFIKPGYSDAYAYLQVKTYPLDPNIQPAIKESWRDYRLKRSLLGTHLLVDNHHLNAETGEPWPKPEREDLVRLVKDAIANNPTRYGTELSDHERGFITDTGVKIDINWDSLSLSQYGKDTARIDWIYKIHYLQWTGYKTLDRVLGFLGLILVALMAISGLRLFFRSQKHSS